MTEKRIDRAVGLWFVFGSHPGGLLVDVSNGTDDVFTGLPKDVAEKVIAEHDQFREKLYAILKDVSES